MNGAGGPPDACGKASHAGPNAAQAPVSLSFFKRDRDGHKSFIEL
jgi:hypothetical protein